MNIESSSNLSQQNKSHKQRTPFGIERIYEPNHDAMLAALRIILDLPRKAVVLNGGKE
jgi:hypothetical protein